jgi:hypothetical protein
MDSFGYTIFVFVPLMAFLLGGAAWVVQSRANRRIDALLAQERSASPSGGGVSRRPVRQSEPA